MDLKKVFLIFLIFLFSCTNKLIKTREHKSVLSIHSKRTEVLTNKKIVKAYRFEKVSKNLAGANFARVTKVKKYRSYSDRKKIRPYVIKKRFPNYPQMKVVTNIGSEKLKPISGKVLQIVDHNKTNYEINVNKSFPVYGFKVEIIKAESNLESLVSQIDWSAPQRAQQNAKVMAKNDVTKGSKISKEKIDKGLDQDKVKFYQDSFSTITSSTLRNDKSVNDELVFFEYDKSKEKKTAAGSEYLLNTIDISDNKNVNSLATVASRGISSSVQEVIARELNKNKGSKRSNQNTPKVPKLDIDKIIEQEQAQNGFVSDQNTSCDNSEIGMSIHGYSVELGIKKGERVFNYDFVPEYNKDEIISDRGLGCITLTSKIQKGSTVRGTFSTADQIMTKADIYVDGETLKVPLVSKTSFTKFLEEKKDFALGGYVLIELAENITSVDIALSESDYSNKYYFDDFFHETDGEDYHYVLFTGISPGNVMIQYLTSDDQIAERVVHVVKDEIYFDMARINKSQTEKFYLFEDGLMSKGRRLIIEGDQIRYFNSDIKAQQKALNYYEVNVPNTPKGMRKYFELSHLGEVIVMGKDNQQNVTLPTRRFIGQILTDMRLDDLKGRCLVQLNSKTPVKEIQLAGETYNGPMHVDYKFLDTEGNFGNFESDSITRVFVTGEYQGVINAKLDFFDGSQKIFQTYCSEETYLVEQI